MTPHKLKEIKELAEWNIRRLENLAPTSTTPQVKTLADQSTILDLIAALRKVEVDTIGKITEMASKIADDTTVGAVRLAMDKLAGDIRALVKP